MYVIKREEIHRKIITRNRCYFDLAQLFISKKLSKKTKINLYRTFVRPIVLYAYVVQVFTKAGENKVIVFERKTLGRIFDLKKNEDGDYKIKTNRYLTNLFDKSNIVEILEK